MAESQQNVDEACDVPEPVCSAQSPLICEDTDRQSVTSSGEDDSQHVTTSVQPLSGRPHLGPYDCKKHMRPIRNPDWVRSCGSDRKVKSPNGTRQNDVADNDVTTTSCVTR